MSKEKKRKESPLHFIHNEEFESFGQLKNKIDEIDRFKQFLKHLHSVVDDEKCYVRISATDDKGNLNPGRELKSLTDEFLLVLLTLGDDELQQIEEELVPLLNRKK